MEKVEPDWRIVRVSQLRDSDSKWIAQKGIADIGMLYLVDVNLHVHICSLTPVLEAWPVQSFVTFKTHELSDADDGETEMANFEAEEPCSYFDLNVMKNKSVPAANYLPEREDAETDDEYRRRAADAVREHLSGNPIEI